MTDALNKLEIGKALNGDRMKFLDKAAITGVDFWVLSSIWYEHQLIADIVVAEEEEEEEEEIVVAEEEEDSSKSVSAGRSVLLWESIKNP